MFCNNMEPINKEGKEVCYSPDCVVLYEIFSKLSITDLVRDTTLSKDWQINLWGSMMDLNFDLHNMFGTLELENLLQQSQHREIQLEFFNRVDKVMLHHQDHGAKIGMFRLEFPFNNNENHKNALHRLISQAISKGVERIELLLSPGHLKFFTRERMRHKFPFTLPSRTRSPLKYLHLQFCYLLVKFDGFKELKNLVLDKITLEHDQILCLLSECTNVEELTIMNCCLSSKLHYFISPTLHQLSILDCRGKGKISIDTLSLSSFDYRGKIRSICSVKAPQLLRFCFSIGDVKEMNKAFQIVASLK